MIFTLISQMFFFFLFNLPRNCGRSSLKLPTALAAYSNVVLQLGAFPMIPFTVQVITCPQELLFGVGGLWSRSRL